MLKSGQGPQGPDLRGKELGKGMRRLPKTAVTPQQLSCSSIGFHKGPSAHPQPRARWLSALLEGGHGAFLIDIDHTRDVASALGALLLGGGLLPALHLLRQHLLPGSLPLQLLQHRLQLRLVPQVRGVAPGCQAQKASCRKRGRVTDADPGCSPLGMAPLGKGMYMEAARSCQAGGQGTGKTPGLSPGSYAQDRHLLPRPPASRQGQGVTGSPCLYPAAGTRPRPGCTAWLRTGPSAQPGIRIHRDSYPCRGVLAGRGQRGTSPHPAW